MEILTAATSDVVRRSSYYLLQQHKDHFVQSQRSCDELHGLGGIYSTLEKSCAGRMVD
jgi:hypothetical protein